MPAARSARTEGETKKKGGPPGRRPSAPCICLTLTKLETPARLGRNSKAAPQKKGTRSNTKKKKRTERVACSRAEKGTFTRKIADMRNSHEGGGKRGKVMGPLITRGGATARGAGGRAL